MDLFLPRQQYCTTTFPIFQEKGKPSRTAPSPNPVIEINDSDSDNISRSSSSNDDSDSSQSVSSSSTCSSSSSGSKSIFETINNEINEISPDITDEVHHQLVLDAANTLFTAEIPQHMKEEIDVRCHLDRWPCCFS